MAKGRDAVGPKKKKHRMRNYLFLALGAAAAVVAVILAFYLLLGDRPAAEVMTDGTFWQVVGVFYGIAVVAFLFLYRVDADRVVMKENDLDDSRWLTRDKMRKSKNFTVCRFSELADVGDGTVISAEKKGGDIEIVMTDELHTLIVGTSGTGKTTGFVDPNIAILSSTKTRPSMIITDPKKELYFKHSASLKKRGYKVLTLDLRSPYSSKRWNPFCGLQRRVVEITEIDEMLEELEYGPSEEGEDAEKVRAEAEVRRQTLTDELEDAARDIVYTLCPIKNKEQASWESGARNLILGFLIALCEDAIEGKIPVEKIVLFNLYQNITKYCSEDTTVLKNYLLSRDEFSKVRGLANTVLVTSDKTLTSYLTDVNAYMQQLADDGILSMTSGSEMDLFSLDDRPTAVFIVVPDEKETRHPFVSLFVSQAYKELTEKANFNLASGATEDAVLKRRMYFILDEFGNIPEIYRMSNIITVARSRGFRFLLILQNFLQLENVYGKSTADSIKSNCNVKIFIGSDDAGTKREFSALCGMRKIKSVSVSTSVSGDPSSSTSAHEVPLVTEAQLQRINGDSQGDAVVSVRGHYGIWGHFTPSYDLDAFYFPQTAGTKGAAVPRMFDKKALFIDIEDIMLEGPETEEHKKLREEFDIKQEKFMKNWEEVMKDNSAYDFPLDGEPDEISPEDERYLEELALEDEAGREPDDSDVCLDLDGELCYEFPELVK